MSLTCQHHCITFLRRDHKVDLECVAHQAPREVRYGWHRKTHFQACCKNNSLAFRWSRDHGGGVVRDHLVAKDPVDHKDLREIRDQVVLVGCVDLPEE